MVRPKAIDEDKITKTEVKRPSAFKRKTQLKNSNTRFYDPAKEPVFFGTFVRVVETQNGLGYLFNSADEDVQVIIGAYRTLQDIDWLAGMRYEIEVVEKVKAGSYGGYYKFNVYDCGMDDGFQAVVPD